MLLDKSSDKEFKSSDKLIYVDEFLLLAEGRELMVKENLYPMKSDDQPVFLQIVFRAELKITLHTTTFESMKKIVLWVCFKTII